MPKPIDTIFRGDRCCSASTPSGIGVLCAWRDRCSQRPSKSILVTPVPMRVLPTAMRISGQRATVTFPSTTFWPIAGVDQLRIDAHVRAGPTGAAFEDVAHAELLGDLRR